MSTEESLEMIEVLNAELRTAARVRRSLDAARAVKTMADALDRASGAESVEHLIDQALDALSKHCDNDDDNCPVNAFLGTLIGELRRIGDVTRAISGAAAVALRAAERVAEDIRGPTDEMLAAFAEAEEDD